MADKIGNDRQLFLSFAVMNLSLLTLSFIRNIVVFTGVIVLYFLGATFLNVALQSSLSEFGGNEKIKGIVFGFVGDSESCGYALGPVVSAAIYDFNNNFLFLSLLAISLIISAIFLMLHRKAHI